MLYRTIVLLIALQVTPSTFLFSQQKAPQKLFNNSKAVYWLSEDHILPNGFMYQVLKAKKTRNLEINGLTMKGASFDLNFYGKKLRVITFSSSAIEYIQFYDSGKDCIGINEYYLKEAYEVTKQMLIECSLEDYICTIEDICEGIFVQELWHAYNENVDERWNEYLSEYPSLDSKVRNFYLAMKFYENTSYDMAAIENEGYVLLREAYKYAFKIDNLIFDISQKAARYKFLLKQYGVEGLIERYKSFE